MAKNKGGRPPGSKSKIGVFMCPVCGPEHPLYKHGPSKSDGQVCLRTRRCRRCGFEAPAVEVLMVGAGLESALVGEVLTLGIEVKQLLQIGGADEREPAASVAGRAGSGD